MTDEPKAAPKQPTNDEVMRSIATSLQSLARSAQRMERHTLHTARMADRIYTLIKVYITEMEE